MRKTLPSSPWSTIAPKPVSIDLEGTDRAFNPAHISSDSTVPFTTMRCNDNISSNPIAKDKTDGIETPYFT